MQSTLALVFAIAGLVCAAPPMLKPTNMPNNNCGDPFGRCYQPLDIVARASPTAPPKGKPTTTTKDDCHTRTVCIDGINKCGIPWGVCIPDCKPWKYQTPECPTPTHSFQDGPVTIWQRDAKPTPTPTTESDGVMTIWDEKPKPTTSPSSETDGVMTIWATRQPAL